jgi:hypothetical protein
MIQFMRNYRQYNSGEVAVFSDDTERHLIRSRVAIACSDPRGVTGPASIPETKEPDEDDDDRDTDDDDTARKPDPNLDPRDRQTTTGRRGRRGR